MTGMRLLPVVLENQHHRATADERDQHEHLHQIQNSMPDTTTFRFFHGNPHGLEGRPHSWAGPLDVVPPVPQPTKGSPDGAEQMEKDGVTTNDRNLHVRLFVRGEGPKLNPTVVKKRVIVNIDLMINKKS